MGACLAGAAAAYAGDLAEIAIGLDDENSAQAWFDIADAAADLIAHLPDPPVSKECARREERAVAEPRCRKWRAHPIQPTRLAGCARV